MLITWTVPLGTLSPKTLKPEIMGTVDLIVLFVFVVPVFVVFPLLRGTVLLCRFLCLLSACCIAPGSLVSSVCLMHVIKFF